RVKSLPSFAASAGDTAAWTEPAKATAREAAIRVFTNFISFCSPALSYEQCGLSEGGLQGQVDRATVFRGSRAAGEGGVTPGVAGVALRGIQCVGSRAVCGSVGALLGIAERVHVLQVDEVLVVDGCADADRVGA